jgi:UDP-N-acetyl-D-glucosamine dehydrogenase
MATRNFPLPAPEERTPTNPRWRAALAKRIRNKEATVGIVGLGYVGLPLLLAVRKAGFPVAGVDTDGEKVRALRDGRSYLTDVRPEDVASVNGEARLSSRYALLRECDVVLICVPTPLRNQEPDLSAIEAASRGVSRHLRPGTLVCLESTTYPGTTEEVVRPIVEDSGMVAGRDFALAYAPERIDPGQDLEHVVRTPRVVGGLTTECTELAAAFYSEVVDQVHRVSSPREAEMAKLIENTFRHVNIGLMNELAIISRDLGVNIWEAIEAAATKPFGYMPFWPGPGVGGHCIAIDPSYLSWRVGQQLGFRMTFVEHAQQVNAKMPAYVAGRIAEALNEKGKAVKGAKILGIGVAYKPNVGDARESPALAVLNRLARSGADVSYHDPHVASVEIAGRRLDSAELTPDELAAYDCVAILTAHSDVNYDLVVSHAPLVFDTRGITRSHRAANVEGL